MKRLLIAILIIDVAITASWWLIPIPGENSLRGLLFHFAGYLLAEGFALNLPGTIAVTFLVTYLELLLVVFAIRRLLKRISAT